MKIHERLKEARLRRGMTQLEVAQALDVRDATVSRWEKGEFLPNVDKLTRWADVVGLRLSIDVNDQGNPFDLLRVLMTPSEAQAMVTALTVVKKVSG